MFSLKLDEFVDTRSFDKLAEMYEVINEERLSAKDTGINYRVINHWDEKGIIRFGTIAVYGKANPWFISGRHRL